MMVRSYRPSRHILRRFAKSSDGAVAVLFSLLLLPLLGSIGLAIDFGQLLTARNKAQVGADAAALQAAGVARDLIKVSDGTEGSTQTALAEAEQRARGLFKAHADQTGLEHWTLEADVTRDGQNIDARVTYTITTDSFLGRLFGQDVYAANGGAGSSSSLPSYVDVHVAMDVSQSMGLASTNEEMKKLYQLTSPSCVFGCHVPQGSQPISNQQVAINNNIKMRIDVLRESVTKMITTAKTDSEDASIYRFGLYTMGAKGGSYSDLRRPHLGELAPLTGQYDTLLTKAQQIDLGPNHSDGVGDTYLKEELLVLKDKLKEGGDGSSQVKARAYVFIITDGVRDAPSGGICMWGHCMGPIDTTVCTMMKSKNVTVGVLYTTYLPVYANPMNEADKSYSHEYQALLVNTGLAPKIAPKLEECASPGWFFEASDGPAIDEALKKMFEQTTNVPRLVL